MPLPAALSDLAGTDILVCEDDDDLREMLVATLESYGARVASAASGNAGWLRFRSQRPDLLISDLDMPDGDGYELVRRIRALPAERGGLTPAIVLSGKHDIEPSLRAGFHVHLIKPANGATLVELVRSFVLEGTETGSTWSVSTPRPDIALVALEGSPTKRDVRAVAASVVELLEANPRQLIIDLRRVDRFEVSAGSVGEQALWGVRRRIAGVTVLGGPYMTKLVARTLCVTLGVACSFLSTATLEALAAAG